MKKISFIILFFFLLLQSKAQEPIFKNIPRAGGGQSGSFGQKKNTDTTKSERDNTLGFERRDDKKDSITITYRFIDSIRNIRLDSSVNDFDKYFSIPSQYQYLGNNGAAAYSLVYKPNLRPGFNAGLNAFDVYKFKLEETRFYKTTKPLTQLGYQLASGKEQMIKVLHTQNPRPNWNFGLDYRLISAPGFFTNQNTNHKSYRLFSTYQGKRKRYALNFVMLGNTIKNSENGGILGDTLLSNPNYKKRFSVPVNLGANNDFTANPFNAGVLAGNIYKDFTFYLKQFYDIGKQDSIAVNDSTTEYLFYPKLRLQHTFTYNTQQYAFKDFIDASKTRNAAKAAKDDSLFFKQYYDTALKPIVGMLFQLREKWDIITNDFSLMQFPDTKNAAQFFLAGVKLQNLKGTFYRTDTTQEIKNFYNIILHGEYRNKTRNRLWDVLLKGELYVNGLNSGDYLANAVVGRYLNKKLGDIRLFFANTSRTPSFIYNGFGAFNLKNAGLTKKENIISFGAEASNNFVNLSFKNHLITNLAYFSNYYRTAQYAKVINLLQAAASKKIKLTKKIYWYAEAVLQQTDGSAPIKVPLLFTRNRIALEGVFYKNLNLSTGLEFRYYTPYEAYNYSPALGQFVPQDTFKLKNLPDVSAFFHFRIKSFTGYIRTENLNTISFSDGFGFTNNNFAARYYPTQGLIMRFGIQWNFVN